VSRGFVPKSLNWGIEKFAQGEWSDGAETWPRSGKAGERVGGGKRVNVSRWGKDSYGSARTTFAEKGDLCRRGGET